jgi:WD40 repeat protein
VIVKIFISSTSEDLKPYRLAAADIVQDAQSVPVSMEHFPADPRPVVQLVRDEIGKCDLIILLQAFRRGWVPTPEQGGDGQDSITGLEIAAADEMGKPVLAFLADDNWPGRLWDADPSARAWTTNFRNGLNRNAKFFKWEEDSKLPLFRALISQELANYRSQSSTPRNRAKWLSAEVTLLANTAEPYFPSEPYPLLQPYDNPHTFAGRDREIAKLSTLVRLPPLVLCLHAASGTGKSSLLLAGLVPRLRGEGYPVSIERAPWDAGLPNRLLRDILAPIDALADTDPDLPQKFAEAIAYAHELSGKTVVLILDQMDDILRSSENKDEVLARIGPLLAATAQRLPGVQRFACKWILSYRHEFHGEIRVWLQDVLIQARKTNRIGLDSLPHDLSDIQKSHDWPVPVMGKPAPGDVAGAQSVQAFLEAVQKPLALKDDAGRQRYPYVMDGAERLAARFARTRQEQPDAPLVPELQVILNHLIQSASSKTASNDGAITINVPTENFLDEEIKHALAHHLQRSLTAIFPPGRDTAASGTERTRVLLALRQLADSEGRRGAGLPESDLVRMLGPHGQSTIARLSSAEARLLVATDGVYSLSHDRLAEVIAEAVRNEASRGNLMLDQGLIDLQRSIGQKFALFESDPKDESALALSRQQRSMIASNIETLLFDGGRLSWWDASKAYHKRLQSRQIRMFAIASSIVAAVAVSVFTLMRPHIESSQTTYEISKANWTVTDEVAVAAVAGQEVLVWKRREPWEKHTRNIVQCPRFIVSDTARHVACVNSEGDVYVWPTESSMKFDTNRVLSGLAWPPDRRAVAQTLQFSPDGQKVLAVLPNGDVYLWDVSQGRSEKDLPVIRVATWDKPSFYGTVFVRFSPGSRWVAINDGEDHLFVFSADAKAPYSATPIAQSRQGSIFSGGIVSFSEDDQWVAWTDRYPPQPEERFRKVFVYAWRVGTSERILLRLPDPANEYDLRLKFSPGAKWLVGRQSFGPFVTWDTSRGSDQIGVLSAGKPPKDGRDRSTAIKFKGQWVAGTANDQKLHLWQPAKPVGLENQALFPGTYSEPTDPSVAFSKTGNMMTAVSPDNKLYVWPLGALTRFGEPMLRSYTGGRSQFSKDDQYLYSADDTNVYVGRVGSTMNLAAESSSRIQAIAVAPDAKTLAIFADNHLILVKRHMYIWGFPLWELDWPELEQPLRLQVNAG